MAKLPTHSRFPHNSITGDTLGDVVYRNTKNELEPALIDAHLTTTWLLVSHGVSSPPWRRPRSPPGLPLHQSSSFVRLISPPPCPPLRPGSNPQPPPPAAPPKYPPPHLSHPLLVPPMPTFKKFPRHFCRPPSPSPPASPSFSPIAPTYFFIPVRSVSTSLPP